MEDVRKGGQTNWAAKYVKKSNHNNGFLKCSLAENQNVVKLGSKSGFSFSKNKTGILPEIPNNYRSTSGIRSVTSFSKTKNKPKKNHTQ